MRAEMLSWLVEQALKCNKTREHRYHLSPGTWTPTQFHPTHAKGECGILMGDGAPLIHPGRAVAPVFTAFSKAAKSLCYLHLGVQQRSWCVWLTGSWGDGTGGSNKLYYLDKTYQTLVREIPHTVWRTLFSFLVLTITTTTKEKLPPTFQVICCLTWNPLAQLTLFQHVLHTEPPVADPRFLWPP